MKITVRKVALYVVATLKEGNTEIDLGMLDDEQRRDLAETFKEAADDLLDGLEPSSEVGTTTPAVAGAEGGQQ